MQPNPDPKPGRWVLPVVVLAMMGFAWLFINAAEDPTVSASDVTIASPGEGSTTTTLPPVTTTTVVELPADVIAYNTAIVSAGIEMAGIQEQIGQANTDWDARTVGYSQTLADLRDLDAQVKTWRTSLDAIPLPTSLTDYADFHAIMLTAATEVSETSGDIVRGLQAPDSGEARKAALALFNESVTRYGNQVNSIAEFRPGADS